MTLASIREQRTAAVSKARDLLASDYDVTID